MAAKDQNGAARLILTDRESKEYPVPIDLPMDALFPPGRRQERVVESIKKSLPAFDAAQIITEKYGLSDRIPAIAKATELVFSLPSVGSKMFLITIADRVSGNHPVSEHEREILILADCRRFDSARSTCWSMADACGGCCRHIGLFQPR